MRILALLTVTFISLPALPQITISGKISDGNSGEDLLFATVQVVGTQVGAVSNEYGFYSLTIPASELGDESVDLKFTYISYNTVLRTVSTKTDLRLDIKMESSSASIEAVVVTAEKDRQLEEVQSTEMATTRLQMSQVKSLPTIGGEMDVLKVVQLLPGVSGGVEGGTGLFVRGGDADQNLVLLDESTVYNVGHLFGFFSVFNPDALKDLTVIKGAFPAQYGGRLSSILDIRMKEGHANEFHGQGGIGLLSSRLTLEGPIKKDKASFLVAGRRTYIDQVFKLFGQTIPYYFYDVNGKANWKINDRDRLFYSIYFGSDVLKFDESDLEDSASADLGLNFGFVLSNVTNTLRWNRIYNQKLFSNISLINTNFNYNINGKLGNNNVLIKSNIFDLGVKVDFDYYPSEKNHLRFGGAVTSHRFKPNIISTAGDISEFLESSAGPTLAALEWALYGNSDADLSARLKMNYGLRLSGAVVPKNLYIVPEPRLAMRYKVSEVASLKASYSRMRQYMHRVASSSVALPTDLWYPVTENIKPQRSDQIAVGYSRWFDSLMVKLEIEAYYKWMNNLIEYREGASLILNDNFEEELLQGTGDSWGFEFLVKRDDGRLTGWISYTLSWSTRDFEDLNSGETFFAKYDRRHVISLVSAYELSKRIDISLVWVYQTGARFTGQIGQYLMPNATLTGVDIIPLYTERNAVTMSPSHRLDLNLTIKPKKERKFHGEWSFGCYNLYNRAQPYRIDIVPIDNGIGFKYQQPGLFGFIPFITYNFKF